jgi:hypothetical protein
MLKQRELRLLIASRGQVVALASLTGPQVDLQDVPGTPAREYRSQLNSIEGSGRSPIPLVDSSWLGWPIDRIVPGSLPAGLRSAAGDLQRHPRAQKKPASSGPNCRSSNSWFD